jgi:hypothetical protein
MSTISIWTCNIEQLIINVNIFNGKAAKKEEAEKRKRKEKEKKDKEKQRKKSGCFPSRGKPKDTGFSSIFK